MSDTLPETLGDRLIVAMKRARVKNGVVAEAACVHVKTVSYWRSGSQRPGEGEIDAIVALLRAHGVSATAAWLRYGSPMLRADVSDAQRLRLAELQLELVRDYQATAQEVATALALTQCAEAQDFAATAPCAPPDALDLMADAVRTELRRRRGQRKRVQKR